MEQNEQIPNITSITSFRCSSFPWCAYRKDLPTYKFMSMPIRTDPISQVHGVPVSGAKVLPPEMHGMPMPPMPAGIPEAMTIHLRAPKMLWGTDTTWGDFEIFKELSERNPEARFKAVSTRKCRRLPANVLFIFRDHWPETMGTTTGIIPSVVDGQSSDLGVTAVILVSNIGTIYIGPAQNRYSSATSAPVLKWESLSMTCQLWHGR